MSKEILLGSFEEIPYSKLWVLERIYDYSFFSKKPITRRDIWRGSYDIMQRDDSFFWKGFDINVESEVSFFQRKRSQIIEYNMSRLLEEKLIKQEELITTTGRVIEGYSLTEEGLRLYSESQP